LGTIGRDVARTPPRGAISEGEVACELHPLLLQERLPTEDFVNDVGGECGPNAADQGCRISMNARPVIREGKDKRDVALDEKVQDQFRMRRRSFEEGFTTASGFLVVREFGGVSRSEVEEKL
jgi:hypothetical protein